MNSADEEFDYECSFQDSDDYRQRLKRNSVWHRALFKGRGKVGLFTNWVEFAAHSDYDEKGRYQYIPGEKAVFMNPLTTRREIDLFTDNLMAGL